MEIFLTLKRYCIETAAKIEYERLIKNYFKSAETDKKRHVIEAQMSALKYFLEKADFSELRSQCNKIGSNNKAILIIPQQRNDMKIHFNKVTIYPKWK